MKNIFDDDKNAVKQLLKDKHTLLEGYITEHLFYNQFLKNNTIPSTDGWWTTEYKNNKLFFIVKEELCPLDEEIINLISPQHECWHVYLQQDKFIFKNNNIKLFEEDFVSKYELFKIRNPMTASKETRNFNRQKQSINFFRENKILRKIAIERKFANNFLTVYFRGMINIDMFTKKNEQINVIEIKYKYESKDGYFGVNTGQMKMFEFFMRLNFNVHHFVLYNFTRDMTLSIFGFLRLNSEPPNIKEWYFKKLNVEEVYNEGIAPEMTSVSGNFRQTYFKIPKREMKKNRMAFVNTYT